MWNKIRIVAGLMLIGVMSVWFIGSSITADSTTPGTVEDPLITKSYVDMKVDEVKAELIVLLGGDIEDSDDDDEEEVATVDMDEVKAYIDEQMESMDFLTDYIDDYVEDQLEDLDLDELTTGDTDSGSAAFQVIRASRDQQLICGASAEVILRSGSASVIPGENGDGLADLTTGVDLQGGDEVPANHHLLVSRDDGRGLLMTQEAGFSYILIKGDYTLE